MRSQLALAMMEELLKRATAIHQAKEDSDLYQSAKKANLILPDQSWPYLAWDNRQNALIPAKTPPIPMTKMLKMLTDLVEEFKVSTLVIQFRAVQSQQSASKSPVVPWRLQLHSRADETYNLLKTLVANSVWHLLCCRLKTHTIALSGLGKSVQETLKGMGKGKTSGKGKGP